MYDRVLKQTIIFDAHNLSFKMFNKLRVDDTKSHAHVRYDYSFTDHSSLLFKTSRHVHSVIA